MFILFEKDIPNIGTNGVNPNAINAVAAHVKHNTYFKLY
jgi:hypothetical protein